MLIETRVESQRLLVLRIGGVLRRAELEEGQRAAAEQFRESGRLAVLIVLDEFQGWERGDEWADTSFLTARDDIEKMAIVGPERWRDEVLAFAGAGLRRSPVAYFPDEAAARAWLAA